jgi:hypothetical protein
MVDEKYGQYDAPRASLSVPLPLHVLYRAECPETYPPISARDIRLLMQEIAKLAQLTFASAISRSITSLAHFKFCAGSGKSWQDILKYPCSLPVSFGPTPASFGGSGVHRTPARTLNLCAAAWSRKGSFATGTTTVRLVVAGCSSPA